MKRLAPLVLAGVLATGCYGSFSASKKVRDWNGQLTGSKVGNSLIHAALWIIPVYELVLVGDLFIFNTVEFATDKPAFR